MRRHAPISGAAPARIRAARQGRICGCLLGKPLEVLSFQDGLADIRKCLQEAGALPLRDYIPLTKGPVVAEADDNINYTVLALTLLEQHGVELAGHSELSLDSLVQRSVIVAQNISAQEHA